MTLPFATANYGCMHSRALVSTIIPFQQPTAERAVHDGAIREGEGREREMEGDRERKLQPREKRHDRQTAPSCTS